MIIIINDDETYLKLLEDNPEGFVINADKKPQPGNLKLHKTTCGIMSSSKWANWTTNAYIKVCSNNVDELETWAVETTGEKYSFCQKCHPERIDEANNSPKSLAVSENDLPFSHFPDSGRKLLGKRAGCSSRHGYGLNLMKKTDQRECAYCGLSLVDTYEHWHLLQVDHVVPTTMGKRLEIPIDWMEDYSNMVLACSGCNTFENQFDDKSVTSPPATESEFFDLRDAVFAQRKILILECQEKERTYYDEKPWEQ